jgi:hypothetical protein
MSVQASSQSPSGSEKLYRKMYYFKIIGGIVTGALNIRGPLGIVVGITFFILTYIMFKNVIKMFSDIPDKKKYYMTGIFSFFLLWFVFWVITINLLYPVLP